MKIPSSFKIFSSEINIKFDSQRLSDLGILGDCSFTDGQINLCKSYKGEELTNSAIKDTLYHEKIHIILDSMGRHDLSKDEQFVEIFARLLRQSDETCIY